ncbi:ABC transporter permease [Fulvivirga sp. M361]|uniref:ABC transporter permease n=1 Tax=Fulvivirga sp. M361 TaxID=2594266 RepID=UPI001626BD04|nr:ABC transporter permease [Fulvivirga sp. M361]
MFRNYIKVIFRNAYRNKLYTLINTAGLTIGLASFIFIALYLYNETNYDDFWESSEQLYRVDASWTYAEEETRYATAPSPLAPTLLVEAPEVRAATRMIKRSDFTLRPETDHSRVFRETNLYIADEHFFRVFSGRLLKGDQEKALKMPGSIVISESAARRYFGDEFYANNEVLGRHILGGKDGGTLWKITGVMKDIPVNSHQNFEMLVSMSTSWTSLMDDTNWSWFSMHTYIRASDALPPEQIQLKLAKRLDDIILGHVVPFLGEPETTSDGVKYHLMPVRDIHLYSHFLREMQPNGDIKYVYVFGLVALLILLVACINFVNLATAQVVRRGREVGVRKVMGSSSEVVILQFILESVMFSMAALVLALGLVELGVIFAEQNFQFHITVGLFERWELITSVVGVALFFGVFAGLYPAIMLTAFRPAQVLKSKVPMSSGKPFFRNALVIFQFCISIGLIMATGIVNDQLNYMKTKNLGFDKENVLVIPNDREIEEERAAFQQALLSYTEITGVSFSSGIPSLDRFMVRDFSLKANKGSQGMRWFEADATFAGTLGLSFLEGRNFQVQATSDSFGILLNQRAVHELGLEEPVGSEVVINQGSDDERTVQVLGVVRDFNFESLHKRVKPLAIEFLRDYTFKDYISIRIAAGSTEEAVKIIKGVWSDFEPQVPLTYSFLDQDFDALFKSEEQLAQLFRVFSILAAIIAGMGLFGLAAYMIQHRNKEIGVRKVLGASTTSVLIMLLKNFMQLSFIGLVIASCLVFFGVREWLNTFAYRTDIHLERFITGGIVAGVITVGAVIYQVVKTALESPLSALKED